MLALLRVAVLLVLYFYTTPGSSSGSRRRQRQQALSGGPLGPPAVPNHEQVGTACQGSSGLLGCQGTSVCMSDTWCWVAAGVAL